MVAVINTLFVLFVFYAIFLVLKELGIFNRYTKKNSCNKVTSEPEELLRILDSNAGDIDKANAFVSLINTSYVYVQVQTNSGNNYNDQAQTKKFDLMLTENALNNLNLLEGKNGQYSF